MLRNMFLRHEPIYNIMVENEQNYEIVVSARTAGCIMLKTSKTMSLIVSLVATMLFYPIYQKAWFKTFLADGLACARTSYIDS